MEVNPLVFETSASTNSAIWAFVFLKCVAKVGLFFNLQTFLDKKIAKKYFYDTDYSLYLHFEHTIFPSEFVLMKILFHIYGIYFSQYMKKLFHNI